MSKSASLNPDYLPLFKAATTKNFFINTLSTFKLWKHGGESEEEEEVI